MTAMNTRRIAACGWAVWLLITGPIFAAESPLADAAERKDAAVVRTLLVQKVNVDAPQADGMTALHWAAYHDEFETAKRFVAAGADVKASNRYGVTPLSLACTNGNASIVELLLEAGADANTSLPGGETVLMTASRTGRLEPVQKLLRSRRQRSRRQTADRADVGCGGGPCRSRRCAPEGRGGLSYSAFVGIYATILRNSRRTLRGGFPAV